MDHRGSHYCLGSREGVLEADNSFYIGDVGLVSGPVVENDHLEEEDRGDHEMEAAGEDNKMKDTKVKMMSSRHPPKSKLGGESLEWEKLNNDNGVIVDQRAKDGWGDKLFRVHWPRESAHQEHKTEEECWNQVFIGFIGFLLKMVHWVGLMHHCLTTRMFLLNINLSSGISKEISPISCLG